MMAGRNQQLLLVQLGHESRETGGSCGNQRFIPRHTPGALEKRERLTLMRARFMAAGIKLWLAQQMMQFTDG
jgi:hypothetical protein